MRHTPTYTLMFSALLLIACNDEGESLAAAGGEGTVMTTGQVQDVRSVASGRAGLTEMVCADAGVGTREEIAATPRADRSLEQLALTLSWGVTADQEIYDRVVRDVARIREISPVTRHINYFPPNDGKSLLLTLEVTAAKAINNGTYDAWNCLNGHYGLQEMRFLGQDHSTLLIGLKGIYNMDLVSQDYSRLPGVVGASANGFMGDGPTIQVTRVQGTPNREWRWTFDDASGDCPAGCTEHVYYCFVSDESGNVSTQACAAP